MSVLQAIQLARKVKSASLNPLGHVKPVPVSFYGVPIAVALTRLDALGIAVTLGCLLIYAFATLVVFYLLVTRHHQKLYAPYDYREESHFVALAQMSSATAVEPPARAAIVDAPPKTEALRKLRRSTSVLEPFMLYTLTPGKKRREVDDEEIDLPAPAPRKPGPSGGEELEGTASPSSPRPPRPGP